MEKYAVFAGKSIRVDTFDSLLKQEILIHAICHGNPSTFRRDKDSEHDKKIASILDKMKILDDSHYVYRIKLSRDKEQEFDKIKPVFCKQNNLECETYEI